MRNDELWTKIKGELDDLKTNHLYHVDLRLGSLENNQTWFLRLGAFIAAITTGILVQGFFVFGG